LIFCKCCAAVLSWGDLNTNAEEAGHREVDVAYEDAVEDEAPEAVHGVVEVACGRAFLGRVMHERGWRCEGADRGPKDVAEEVVDEVQEAVHGVVVVVCGHDLLGHVAHERGGGRAS
jgi:hypothetical protein